MKMLTALLIGLVGVAGCAKPQPEPVAVLHLPAEPSRSLVFTPEIARYGPALDLDRAGRGEAAFAGYRSPVVTYNFIRLDDRQRQDRFGNYDRTERRSVSTRVYVQTR